MPARPEFGQGPHSPTASQWLAVGTQMEHALSDGHITHLFSIWSDRMKISWQEFEQRFSRASAYEGFPPDYVERCIAYAKPLYEQNLPIIFDNVHFSKLVGVSTSYLFGASNKPKKFYRTFCVPKKTRGKRTISEPLPTLKMVQRWLLERVLYQVKVSGYAKAYVPGRSLRENARFHLKQTKVLRLDIKNFFGSIKHTSVRGIFLELGYRNSLAELFTNLTTLDSSLPQGAPTSPALSNLICRPIDSRISGYCKKNGLRYTRYADDLTFSGHFRPAPLIRFVQTVLRDYSLTLNTDKTRLMHQRQQQRVTGIVVNQKLQAPRDTRRSFRQNVYYIRKFGLQGHQSSIELVRGNYLEHLIGVGNFIVQINPSDERATSDLKYLQSLRSLP